jgi:hypothetical protein
VVYLTSINGLAFSRNERLQPIPVVGHILFSSLTIETENRRSPCRVAGTDGRTSRSSAPGNRRGLELCLERGKSIVVVLGHPGYYPRFGFSTELAQHLRGPYSGDAWMALELIPGALRGVEENVRYSIKAFKPTYRAPSASFDPTAIIPLPRVLPLVSFQGGGLSARNHAFDDRHNTFLGQFQ